MHARRFTHFARAFVLVSAAIGMTAPGLAEPITNGGIALAKCGKFAIDLKPDEG